MVFICAMYHIVHR